MRYLVFNPITETGERLATRTQAYRAAQKLARKIPSAIVFVLDDSGDGFPELVGEVIFELSKGNGFAVAKSGRTE